MSFEIYLQRFRAGERDVFSRHQVETVLGPAMVRQGNHSDCIPLVYPDGDAGELYIKDAAEISAFTIVHPATDALFDDLFTLMKEIGAVVYWPDSAPCLVIATEDAKSELPPDMLDALGPPILVASGQEIVRAIKRAT